MSVFDWICNYNATEEQHKEHNTFKYTVYYSTSAHSGYVDIS